MNVTELSRRVNIPTKRLKEILPELGFDIGMRAIKVDDRVAQAIIEKLNRSDIRIRYLARQNRDDEATEQEEKKQASPSGTILIPRSITVRDFSEKLGIPVTKAIIELMKQGIMAAQNQRIDFETAAIIAGDFGKTVERESEGSAQTAVTDNETSLASLLGEQNKERLVPRPPVIVVMGHVDHGKTKLLDAIRKSNVAAHEHGGITQHIGAYTVMHQGRNITFIDTPGHEAFTAMRSRGARVADIAILVVAADDGVQPQTIEALSHIQRAELPFIVAINKIDKDTANPERIKQDLAQVNVTSEEWGGKTPFSLISAKEGTGIPGLLDLILLITDIEKDRIVADPAHQAIGTIIESHIDKGEGPVATVLIQSGTLHIGDQVAVGQAFGRIKAMKDYQGGIVPLATPSLPVRILGLKHLPQVGDILQAIEDKETFKQKIRDQKPRKTPLRFAAQTPPPSHAHEESDSGKEQAQGPKVNLLIKGDVLGSLEAIHEALRAVQHPSVAVQVIHQGLGTITEADILTAEAAHALVLGFNVTVSTAAEELAKDKEISVTRFTVIYNLIDEVKKAVEQQLAPFVKETDTGVLGVLAVFRQEPAHAIIGCRVLSGKITPNSWCRLKRDNKVIAMGKIASLQIGQQSVKEVNEGQECGMKLDLKGALRKGDVIEAYIKETITPTFES